MIQQQKEKERTGPAPPCPALSETTFGSGQGRVIALYCVHYTAPFVLYFTVPLVFFSFPPALLYSVDCSMLAGCPSLHSIALVLFRTLSLDRHTKSQSKVKVIRLSTPIPQFNSSIPSTRPWPAIFILITNPLCPPCRLASPDIEPIPLTYHPPAHLLHPPFRMKTLDYLTHPPI